MEFSAHRVMSLAAARFIAHRLYDTIDFYAMHDRIASHGFTMIEQIEIGDLALEHTEHALIVRADIEEFLSRYSTMRSR